MARLIKSAFNQAGTFTDDPSDQADRLGFQAAQQNRGDDWRRELALGQLGLQRDQLGVQRDQFNSGQSLAAQLAGAQLQDRRDERKVEGDRFGKQFDYMAGRDKGENDWRSKLFDTQNQRYEAERADQAPYRQAQLHQLQGGMGLTDIQTKIAQQQLADMLAKQTAANAYQPALRGPLAGAAKEAYDQVFGATGDAKQATAAANAASRAKDTQSAQLAGTELGNAAANFNDRAGEWFDWTGRNTGEDTQRVKGLFDQYKQALIKSGVEEMDAERQARAAIDPILKNDPLIGSGVNTLRQALGLAGVR
jgi:hypothetical protein